VTDGQTDGQNYDSQNRASIAASRGKKNISLSASFKLASIEKLSPKY